jgi:transposase, IS5 family
MKPQKISKDPQIDLFKIELNRIVDRQHPLVKLAHQMDWAVFDREFESHFCEEGRPAIPTRLMVTLHYLKYTYDLSDEETVARWAENPYWQYLSGRQHFEYALPIDPSSMTRWRNRVSVKGAETLLSQTIRTGIEQGYLKRAHCERVSVDTTVQTKDIRFPTDARLYDRMREVLVRSAGSDGVDLRQSYTHVGKRILRRQQNYAHAKQMRRAAGETKKLKTLLGRVVRDIERKEPSPTEDLKERLALAKQLLIQARDSKNKIYSIHEPHVECIAKGKAHQRYEFGCKVGFVVTTKGNWIVGAQAFDGNPYDGHTLQQSLNQAEQLTGTKVQRVVCDQGYRGHGVTTTDVSIVPRRKSHATQAIRRWWRRRNAIEPIIGHEKSDHRLNRNQLAGELGDQINVILSACGFNFKKLTRAFWFWLQNVFNGASAIHFQRAFS